jgi:hypothetical protein
VSSAAITLFIASQRVFVVVYLSTQSGNFWIHRIISSILLTGFNNFVCTLLIYFQLSRLLSFSKMLDLSFSRR